MAILKSSLEEPLLTREQTSVIRAIAHAAQISEAIKQLDISATIVSNGIATDPSCANIREYLKAELSRTLTQVKIPKRPVATLTKDDSNKPDVLSSVVTPPQRIA